MTVSVLSTYLCMTLLAVVFAWYGAEFARFGSIQASEMSGINMLSIYISFPLAGVTWILFLAEKIVEDIGMIKSEPSETIT